MPSPIAHIAAGWAIAAFLRRRFARVSEKDWPTWLIPITVGISLLPDLDFVLGIWAGDPSGFHNHLSHSLLFGCVVALVIGLLCRDTVPGFVFWFMLGLFVYQSHVILDYFTVGRGVMVLWPFCPERLSPPIKFFYGLDRSVGVWSARHLLTLGNELLFALLVGFWMWLTEPDSKAT